VHGLAHLLLDGALPGDDPEALVRGVLEDTADLLLTGRLFRLKPQS